MKSTVFLFLLLMLLAQAPAGTLSQRSSRRQLEHMNVAFTSNRFIQTVAEGDVEACELFLAAGMSPDAVYRGEPRLVGGLFVQCGDTALIVAVKRDVPALVSSLLSHGARVNLPANDCGILFADSRGRLPGDESMVFRASQTALLAAARRGRLEEIDLLLRYGADLTALDELGRTAIELAAANGGRSAVQFLLMHGADVSALPERTIRVITTEPDLNDEVTRLIHGLYRQQAWGTRAPPSDEEQERIPARILDIAAQSSEMRQWVIEKMTDVVVDPEAREEPTFAHAWMTAVDVLGKLKATEAIDVLVNDLDRSGQNGVIASILIQPAYAALVRIGTPAVPLLEQALHHRKPGIQAQAAWVLLRLERRQAKDILQSALQTEDNEFVRSQLSRAIERTEQWESWSQDAGH